MDAGLIAAIGAVLGAVVAGLTTVITGIQVRRSVEQERLLEASVRSSSARRSPIGTVGGEQLAHEDVEEIAQLGRMMTAFRTELENDRRSAFWPNFWSNLAQNVIVGAIFFVLGILVTLYLGQPH